ncbi:hypothetical protein ACIRPX_28795 [Streptomyces sp. NPDC101225]|uniref:hypothetical protein n=1 Tax=Streptomyces sp. NPDC101225 TaxID=3366135 RepID=UPI0038273D09
MISQKSWLRRHITPVAKAEGMSKKDNVLRLAGDRGDCAVLEFEPHPMDPSTEVFFVKAAIVPTPERAWVHREGWEVAQHRPPTSAAAMVSWYVLPPASVAYDPDDTSTPARRYWAYGGRIDPEECGRQLAGELTRDTIPRMRLLLDRDRLLDEVRAKSPGVRVGRPPGWADVLLNVDRVSPADLERLLERVERDYPVADEFTAWARRFAATSRTAAGR